MYPTKKYVSLEFLSKKLDLPGRIILELAKDSPHLYYYHTIRKKESGKKRKLQIPYLILKNFQRRLLGLILEHIPIHYRLYGSPGTSIKDAVRDHIRKDVVITMDIKDFFPSIPAYKIRAALNRFCLDRETSIILTRLVTHNNRLPQGAPTSPCIGRIVLTPFARELERLLNKIPNSFFSIYVDDITISGPKDIKGIIQDVYQLLARYGYRAKEEKTNIMDRDREQVSLNVKLNNRIEATNEFLKEIEELEKKLPASNPSLRGKKEYVRFLSASS